MAINSGIPNREGITVLDIYTSVSPGGTPGPASTNGAGNVKIYSLPAASTGDTQKLPGTTTGPTVPVDQIVGESHEVSGVFATISAGSPTAGQSPAPAPTVKAANGGASTGQQPAVTTPYTDAAWSTKSVV